MVQPAKPVFLLSSRSRGSQPTLASYCWILIAVFGALLDRFGRPRVEQELVGQEGVGESIDPVG
jgi:hypothetical protein